MRIDQEEKKAILMALKRNIQDQLPDQEREQLVELFNKILKAKKGEKIELR
jgi:DNA-binding MarR family transcriptional regulator